MHANAEIKCRYDLFVAAEENLQCNNNQCVGCTMLVLTRRWDFVLYSILGFFIQEKRLCNWGWRMLEWAWRSLGRRETTTTGLCERGGLPRPMGGERWGVFQKLGTNEVVEVVQGYFWVLWGEPGLKIAATRLWFFDARRGEVML